MLSFGFIGGSNGLLESNRYTAMVRNWVGNTGGSNKIGTISRIQIEDTSGVTIKLEEFRVGSIIISSQILSAIPSFLPAVLGVDVSSQDGCFALKSPRSVISGNSSLALAWRFRRGEKKVSGCWSGGR